MERDWRPRKRRWRTPSGQPRWPTQNHALLTVVEDSLVAPVMAHLKDTDAANPNLGLRAYLLPVEEGL